MKETSYTIAGGVGAIYFLSFIISLLLPITGWFGTVTLLLVAVLLVGVVIVVMGMSITLLEEWGGHRH